MRSFRMVVIGGIMLLGCGFGAKEGWSEHAEMQALLKTGEQAHGLVMDKRVEQIKSRGRRGRTNITNVHYLNCIFATGKDAEAALPAIATFLALENGINVPESVSKAAQETEIDLDNLDENMSVDGAEIRASEEYYNSITPGAKVQLAVRWDAKDELQEAVFIGDAGRQGEGYSQMTTMAALAVVGLILAIIGISPGKEG